MGDRKQFYNIAPLLKSGGTSIIFLQERGAGKHHAKKAYEEMKKCGRKYNSTK